MSKVKGNPETLNDVGNRMLTSSRDLTGSGAAVGEQGTFDRASLGQATVGVMIHESYDVAVYSCARLVENLCAVLESDGEHLQRASRDIDEVMNRTEP
ncbi:hypothetical protein G1H11_01650 [Phytoactinopolyspora alkaliphila]|uniref:ESX-1 secretion-associated protein n=1 Tax=Phytoactinopolyspora alkaliphila TaxID=1783498 RepID=A0A6N9YG25_9ACTN|nr:hypothetical protein [Phytoactinopolyspora alkaliphila]NED94011.1 hypothetical protein [Phytoactinopolyspora alkaliphila]